MNNNGYVAGEPPIGLVAFDSLRAEAEPWLQRCLVPPPFFDLLCGGRSRLVYGEAGSGKTALFQALIARLALDTAVNEPPHHLLVRWRPRPLEPGVAGFVAARAQFERSLAECAGALIEYVRFWPGVFCRTQDNVRRTLTWFVHRYLGPEAAREIEARAAGAGDEAREAFDALLSGERHDKWLSAAEPKEMIAELIKALRAIGPQMVHIVVGPEDIEEPEEIERSLRAFLSAPALFENYFFAYKMVLPAGLGESLAQSGAVNRRRADVHILSWHQEDLEQMVVRRTAVASGIQLHSLAEICEDKQLGQWLERTGADSPRGWLRYATPLVTEYLARRRTITTDEWRAIRVKSPPPLSFDDETGVVTIGRRRVEGLAEGQLALLEYLYRRRGRVCSRQDLYYQAYQPLSHTEPATTTPRESPVEYDHVLDSAISRLRQEIEPDPKTRIYVVTVRGKGYKLDNAY